MKNRQLRELAVCGFEAVQALITHNPEKIQRMFFTRDRARTFGTICKMLAAQKKIYRTVDNEKELERISGSVHHQGVVAMIPEPKIPILTEQELGNIVNKNVVLLLDRVGNANNLGAIIRSAAFFGLDTIILSDKDDQARISTSMYRVAQGGMEFVKLWKVPETLWILKRVSDSMTRIGADHRSSTELSELNQHINAKKPPLIILGNEEHGLSPETRDCCDFLVKISGCGVIESLNVAQAATVFIYTATKIVEKKQQ